MFRRLHLSSYLCIVHVSCSWFMNTKYLPIHSLLLTLSSRQNEVVKEIDDGQTNGIKSIPFVCLFPTLLYHTHNSDIVKSVHLQTVLY